MRLDRTVRRIAPDGRPGPSEPLAAYRDTAAWVLLGDPGAGKTTAFEAEASRSPESEFVSARDFLTLDPAHRPEWRERTLLIDGLDEVRAGQADARTPFDAIRARLDRLGKPRFRLSCREADWLGNNDRERLKAVSPDGEIVVLRLDPLSDAQVRDLASDLLGDSDPAAFFAAASDRGLEPLLGNPQNLELLAGVFSDSGQLPASRLETFDQYSALLAPETNEEHLAGGGELPVESILDAAGWLSAVQLLSGAVGHCDSEPDAPDGYIPISTHDKDRRADIRAALRTRLFAADGDRRFRPAHAHLAAFLAARRLARLVEEGIPKKNRILGLLAGHDGAPPTPLRGLVAWLAATCPPLRRSLIERDPVAVLMYGDVRGFTSAQKTFLLDSLGRDHSRLHESLWPSSAVAALANRDMEDALRKRLRDSDRSDASQKVVEVITAAFYDAPPAPGLADDFESISRDASRTTEVRLHALDAWIRSLGDASDRVPRLRKRLSELHAASSTVTDSEMVTSEMVTSLLKELYPADLSASEIWDYFSSDSISSWVPNTLEFWQTLSETCPDKDLPEHLDRLARSINQLRTGFAEPHLREVPLRLLARALEGHGEQVETPRLLEWLQVGLDETGRLTDRGSEPKDLIERVRRWLNRHPRVQKSAIAFALRSDRLRPRELLYRSEPPADIADWHLDQAVAAGAEDPKLAESHLTHFLEALAGRPVSVDSALGSARSRLGESSDAVRFLNSGLKSDLPDGYLEDAANWRHLRDNSRRGASDLLEAVRSNETALRENRADDWLLYGIAVEYRAPDTPGAETTDRDRLLAALGGDEDLTDVAIAGIRRAPDREDLLSVEEILQLRLEQRPIPFALPVLLGLAERSAEEVLHLDEARLRAALAFRLARGGFPERAAWYDTCLQQRPHLVAEVLILFGRRLLQNGDSTLRDLYHFARKDTYAQVAKKATLPLLRAFPLRARANQLKLLDELLQSALVHCDNAEFRAVIDGRTTLDSMTRTQRVHWLAAGLACDPEAFGRQLSAISDSQLRASVLKSFYTVHRVPGLTGRLAPAALEILVRELGKTASPILSDSGSTFVWGGGTSMGVEEVIRGLSRSSMPAATDALRKLVSDPELEKWERELQHARDIQSVVRRDADYRAPTPNQVIEVLRDGPPAGAADLGELVVDRLKRIAEEARTTNANLWRQFWNEDAGKPTKPKYENACRDALLARLRHRLPAGCDAQPEGQYAGNRRADLRISCGEWNVPVEIKKTSHSDLWRAVGNQLLPRYTNDPATEGLGIYLVLWFGRDPKMRLAPNGKRPKTPKKLRKWLRAALKPEERRRAAVLVMDVTPPLTVRRESRASTGTDGAPG